MNQHNLLLFAVVIVCCPQAIIAESVQSFETTSIKRNIQSATIVASIRHNRTGLSVSEGEVYQFQSQGYWIDKKYPSDATGFNNPFLDIVFGEMKRVPNGKFFSLICEVGQYNREIINIGELIETNRHYTAKRSGELICYANDVYYAYCNNKGSVDLSVWLMN
ncbi:MAG: hypothetical protein OEZ58_18215 [Gammaproteobacteria bacterium]|nr:hypothetical protein [Gammaproteobacteria bacterium]